MLGNALALTREISACDSFCHGEAECCDCREIFPAQLNPVCYAAGRSMLFESVAAQALARMSQRLPSNQRHQLKTETKGLRFKPDPAATNRTQAMTEEASL